MSNTITDGNAINGPLDLTGSIIAWEQGELNDEETIEFFQQLINTGLCWQLQGSYSRTAIALIESGECFYENLPAGSRS